MQAIFEAAIIQKDQKRNKKYIKKRGNKRKNFEEVKTKRKTK